MALFFRIVPKIGPFKGLGFKNPTPQTEDLYFKSINATVDQYRSFLHEVKADSLRLTNCDLDSGKVTHAGEYSLADDTYAKLLHQLADHKFDALTPELRNNILTFYSNPAAPLNTKRKEKENDWKNVQTELDQLKAAIVASPSGDLKGDPKGDMKTDSTTAPPATPVCAAGQ
jgi:hypothetical protein